VSRQALHPRLPNPPGLFDHMWRLTGSLNSEVGANCLQLYVLDKQKEFLPELDKLAQRVTALFGISLPPSRGGE